MAPDLGADRRSDTAGNRGRSRYQPRADGIGDGGFECGDAPCRQHSGEPDLCDRGAGSIWPGLGHFITRRRGWNWLVQAVPWVGLIIGAMLGGAAYLRIGEAVIWVPVGFAGLIAAYSVAIPQPD